MQSNLELTEKPKQFTMYTANTFQQAANIEYPNKAVITCFDDLKKATYKDNVCSLFADNKRSNNTFIEADAFSMDLDNTHSEQESSWRTIEDVKQAFPGVAFYYVYSRNHNKEKKKTNGDIQKPRYKAHIYFPLSRKCPQEAQQQLSNVKTAVGCLFPYFDSAAADIAHFYFGIAHEQNPCGAYIPGSVCIDEYIQQQAAANTLTSSIKNSLTKAEQETVNEYGSTWAADKKNPDLKNWKERSRIITGEASPAASNTQYDNIGISTGDFKGEPNLQQIEKAQYFEAFAERHSIEFTKKIQGTFIYYFVSCPWKGSHTSSDNGQGSKITIIPLQDGGAAIRYNCWHAHCLDKSWKDYKAFYEPEQDIDSKWKEYKEAHSKPAAETPAGEVVPRPDNISYYIDNLMSDEIERFKVEVKTGFDNLDKAAGGLYGGLYVIAAISSLGKTTFSAQMADQIAASGTDVLYFSLEQSKLEMVSKSIARITYRNNPLTAVTSLSIRRGYLPAHVLQAAAQYKQEVQERISVIEGNFNCNVSAIRDYIREYIMHNEGSRPVVFIDYLQILQPEQQNGRQQSTKEMVDYTVTELKRLSRELNITIIVISSVNRSNYLTPIDFESLKESGSIEYSADVIWGLQLQCLHDDVFNQQNKIAEKREAVQAAKAADPRKVELVCLKNRYGISSYSTYFNYHPANDFFEPSLDNLIPVTPRKAANRI